jgi:phage-related protein
VRNSVLKEVRASGVEVDKDFEIFADLVAQATATGIDGVFRVANTAPSNDMMLAVIAVAFEHLETFSKDFSDKSMRVIEEIAK